ncbi:MAG: TonB-dependent receptor [Thermoanaerobaculia bacterium]
MVRCLNRIAGPLGVCLILALVAVSPAWAQAVHEGSLTGTVYLSSGEPAPGVTVTIISPALVSGERMMVSDDEGRFVFLSIPPGSYELRASLDGFSTYSQKGIVIRAGDKASFKVRLEPGSYEETIIVTADSPVFDTRSATTDTTFSKELLEVVPTGRSAFYDLATSAPGVAPVGKEESWLPSPSVLGSAANENIFLVNGVNATNPRGASWGSLVNVNYNTVQEVKIIATGSKAEYGSFSGAAIDVLTKSGGNDFMGDLAYYGMVGNASDNMTTNFGGIYYAAPDAALMTRPVDSDDASITFGGPVLKNKLWFFAAYNDVRSKTDTPLFEPLAIWKAKLYDLKFTGEFAMNHRAWLAYHGEDTQSDNTSWGDTWDASMVYTSPQKNQTLQAEYQWMISSHDLVSGKLLGYDTKQDPTIPAEYGHPGWVNWWKWIGAQSIGLGGDFPFVEAQKSKRQTLQADITHYAEHFLGEHEMKFGVQYTKAEGNWEGGYFQGYANFAYPYPWDYGPAKDWWWNGPESWQWGTDENPVFPMYVNKIYRNPWLTVRKSGSTGAFFDDTWDLNDRLTLNVGLRYDEMTAKYGEGKVYEMPTTPADINNPTVLRNRAGTGNVFDFKTWSPRLGFAWNITGDNKTVLRGHVGRYYAPMGVEALRRFGPDMEPSLTETWLYLLPMSEVDLNGNGMVDFEEVRPATRLLNKYDPSSLMSSNVSDPSWYLQVDPGTRSPYTDQYNLSIQRQIGSKFAVEFGYIHKKTNDMISLEPYNTATGEFYQWESLPFTTWTGYNTQVWSIQLQDYNGDGVADVQDAVFVSNHLRYRAVNVQDFAGQDATRTYDGLQTVFTKRYSDRWQGMASINWNRSNGIAPRTVDQNWYIDGPMVMDTPFGSSRNHFQNNMEGPLPMTPKWMVKISGNYTLPMIETDFGLRYRYDSGRPIFPIQTIPVFATWMSEIPEGVYLGPGDGGMVASDPKHPDWLPSTSIVDLSLSKSLKAGGFGALRISFDVLNAFNENSPNKVGFYEGDYGRVYSIVQPRTYRMGVKYSFGG